MSIAVFQRRDKLFFKLGYDKEEIPRDVPKVLVLDFTPDVPVPAFADAGSVLANSINFAMGQFGRYQNFPMSQRLSIIKSLSSNNLDDILKNLNDKMNDNEIPQISYLLYGEYNLSGRYIECNAKLMDAKTGVVIAHFTVSDNSKYSTHTISIDLAKKMYNTIPFRGKIISYSEDMAVINLGTIDGIETGALLETYVENNDTIEQDQLRKKVVFKVTEAGTIISSGKPVNPKDIDLIAKGSEVYPVEKKRAKKIK